MKEVWNRGYVSREAGDFEVPISDGVHSRGDPVIWKFERIWIVSIRC